MTHSDCRRSGTSTERAVKLTTGTKGKFARVRIIRVSPGIHSTSGVSHNGHLRRGRGESTHIRNRRARWGRDEMVMERFPRHRHRLAGSEKNRLIRAVEEREVYGVSRSGAE